MFAWLHSGTAYALYNDIRALRTERKLAEGDWSLYRKYEISGSISLGVYTLVDVKNWPKPRPSVIQHNVGVVSQKPSI
jgi:hypothetical protein